jgi:hypothetical protein
LSLSSAQATNDGLLELVHHPLRVGDVDLAELEGLEEVDRAAICGLPLALMEVDFGCVLNF